MFAPGDRVEHQLHGFGTVICTGTRAAGVLFDALPGGPGHFLAVPVADLVALTVASAANTLCTRVTPEVALEYAMAQRAAWGTDEATSPFAAEIRQWWTEAAEILRARADQPGNARAEA